VIRGARQVFRGLLPVLLLACPAFLAAQRPLGDAFLVNPPEQAYNFAPHLATNSAGEFVVAWIAQPAGFAQLARMGGQGNFVVTWEQSKPAAVFARRFAADGAPLGPAVRVAPAAPGGPRGELRGGLDERAFATDRHSAPPLPEVKS
jgi:hypothetical protein